MIIAKLQSSSNPGPNPITSLSFSSSLMMENNQGSSIFLLLLHHQTHQLQLSWWNWKHSHLEIYEMWPPQQLDIDYIPGGIGTSAILRCVFFDSGIHTETFCHHAAYIYPQPCNRYQSLRSLRAVCEQSAMLVRIMPAGLYYS